MTVREAEIARLSEPLLAVTVKYDVPVVETGDSEIFRRVSPDALTMSGLNVAVAPVGRPVTLAGLKVTAPVKPLVGFTFTAYVAKPVEPVF